MRLAIQGATKLKYQTGRPSNPVAVALRLSRARNISYSENSSNDCLAVDFSRGGLYAGSLDIPAKC